MPAFPILELKEMGDEFLLDSKSDGLTKREMIAAKMDVKSEVADYSLDFLQKLVGRERPSSVNPYDVLAWDAEAEAIMRVIKADALFRQLEKQL